MWNPKQCELSDKIRCLIESKGYRGTASHVKKTKHLATPTRTETELRGPRPPWTKLLPTDKSTDPVCALFYQTWWQIDANCVRHKPPASQENLAAPLFLNENARHAGRVPEPLFCPIITIVTAALISLVNSLSPSRLFSILAISPQHHMRSCSQNPLSLRKTVASLFINKSKICTTFVAGEVICM